MRLRKAFCGMVFVTIGCLINVGQAETVSCQKALPEMIVADKNNSSSVTEKTKLHR